MNEEIRKKREEEITGLLRGKTIAAVNYYVMNRNTYLHPDSPLQLTDAGVEFVFTDESVVTFGWDFSVVILDVYAGKFADKLKSFNDSLAYMQIPVSEDAKWKEMMGKSIHEIHFAWNWYEDMDEQVHYVPQDMELLLSDAKYLALCTTSYSVDEEGINITHPDSEGELLVLFDAADTEFYKRGRFYDPAAFGISANADTPDNPMDYGEQV